MHEMMVGPHDLERLGMAKHRLLRLLAPHTQENPIFFHMIHSVSNKFHCSICIFRKKIYQFLAKRLIDRPFNNERCCLFPKNSTAVRSVLDQMAEVGFEMMIYSFGSGFSIEITSEAYLKHIADDIAYAHSKGIEVRFIDCHFIYANDQIRYWSTQSSCLSGNKITYITMTMLS